MTSAVRHTRAEREESCFSRAARAIRRALSRICRDSSPRSNVVGSLPTRNRLPQICLGQPYSPRSETECKGGTLPFETNHDQLGSSDIVYGMSGFSGPPGSLSSIHEPRKRVRSPIFPKKKKYKRDSFNALTTDSSAYMLDQPPPGALTERGTITSLSAADSDKTLEMELNATAGPPTLQLSDSAASHNRKKELDELCGGIWFGCAARETHFCSPPLLDPYIHLPNRKYTDDGAPSFKCGSVITPICSQFIIPAVAGPPCPQGRPTVIQDSTICTEGSIPPDAFELWSVRSDGDPEACSDALLEMDGPVTAVNYLVTKTLPGDPPRRDSRRPPRSHSMPSLSRTTSEESKTFRSTESLPDMLLKTTYEEFTPDMAADENDETYRFQCSFPGLYLCSVTGLVFHMEGGGDVVYRTVPWDRRLLGQHHKKPAGPLFDIKCVQQSVCWLHLPHCEIGSTGGCDFLSVAHVNDDGVEFISPHKVTESHVVINITGFSGFGNVKDEDSPPDPVRALVLLFYRPPAGPDPESLLNVLLLPRNVVLQDVLRTRKKLVGDESYIETSPHCKLHPKQEYTLSTCPEDDSVLVQPTEAEFDCDNYDNFFPSFQVNWETTLKHIKLILRDTNSSHSVWERRVCLSSTGVKRSCVASALNLPPNERLLGIRSSFIDGISGPVLKSLLDKLFEKAVMTDSEGESADEMQNKRDKARFVIDTVRKKGEAASSEMIEFLCEADPFLCEHLELM